MLVNISTLIVASHNMCSGGEREKSVSSGPQGAQGATGLARRDRVSDHHKSCHYHNISGKQFNWNMSDDESSIRESSFCVLPKLKWKALMWCWMLWKFESANIYLNESEGKLPQLTLIFSSNTNIPQLHSLTLSPLWISSPENLFSANQYWIKLSSSSQPSGNPVILSEHVSTLARVHWVVRSSQWYSCYAFCFVIIPSISTFSQNEVSPFQIID